MNLSIICCLSVYTSVYLSVYSERDGDKKVNLNSCLLILESLFNDVFVL